jgi:hypothetical protein
LVCTLRVEVWGAFGSFFEKRLGEIGEEGEQISRIKMQKYKAKIKM